MYLFFNGLSRFSLEKKESLADITGSQCTYFVYAVMTKFNPYLQHEACACNLTRLVEAKITVRELLELCEWGGKNVNVKVHHSAIRDVRWRKISFR